VVLDLLPFFHYAHKIGFIFDEHLTVSNEQGLSLGLDVSVSRRSRDQILIVSVSKDKVSFTSLPMKSHHFQSPAILISL